MSECAAYNGMDFVDYFAHVTGVSNAHLLRIAGAPKLLAVIDAFVTTPMRLGTALFHLGDEFERLLPETGRMPRSSGRKKRYHYTYTALIKQIARRIELDSSDPRCFSVTADVKQQFSGMYQFRPMSELDYQIWLNRDAPFESYDRELEDIWQTIRRHDGYKYLWYWEIAHSALLQDLFCNRRFVAGLEASYASTSQSILGADHIYGMLDAVFGCQIPWLPISFRFMLYAHLAHRMATGLIHVPRGLGAEFPEYYSWDDDA